MEKNNKKQLKDNYKNRAMIGGVYCIKCSGNDRKWIKSTKDIPGQKNRYKFFFSTNTCPEPSMITEWNSYGAESFSFIILEEINKGETQTEREFTNDLESLLEMWIEKQKQED